MMITDSRLFSARLLVLAGLAFGVAFPVLAQNPAENRLARTEARQARQDTRIGNGVEAGGINANEAARLQNQQGRIDNRADRLAGDGFYSRRDHAGISAQQRRSSQNIAIARVNRR